MSLCEVCIWIIPICDTTSACHRHNFFLPWTEQNLDHKILQWELHAVQHWQSHCRLLPQSLRLPAERVRITNISMGSFQNHCVYISRSEQNGCHLADNIYNIFSWKKIDAFAFDEIKIQTIIHHWFRLWLDAKQASKPLPQPTMTKFSDYIFTCYHGSMG